MHDILKQSNCNSLKQAYISYIFNLFTMPSILSFENSIFHTRNSKTKQKNFDSKVKKNKTNTIMRWCK